MVLDAYGHSDFGCWGWHCGKFDTMDGLKSKKLRLRRRI